MFTTRAPYASGDIGSSATGRRSSSRSSYSSSLSSLTRSISRHSSASGSTCTSMRKSVSRVRTRVRIAGPSFDRYVLFLPLSPLSILTSLSGIPFGRLRLGHPAFSARLASSPHSNTHASNRILIDLLPRFMNIPILLNELFLCLSTKQANDSGSRFINDLYILYHRSPFKPYHSTTVVLSSFSFSYLLRLYYSLCLRVSPREYETSMIKHAMLRNLKNNGCQSYYKDSQGTIDGWDVYLEGTKEFQHGGQPGHRQCTVQKVSSIASQFIEYNYF